MPSIIKVYTEKRPAAILVGKVYRGEDMGESGGFSQKWEEWFQNGWFELMQAHGRPADGSYVGAMRMTDGEFEYWIGMLMEAVDGLPEGFLATTVPGAEVGVVWVKGKDDGGLYSMLDDSIAELAAKGLHADEGAWYFERYVCPRFTEPDENGEVILDYVVTLKG